MSLEEDLRTVLHERAAQRVPRPDLLTAVDAGIRRDRRRRQALAAGGVAAAVVAAAVAVPATRHKEADPAPPTTKWEWSRPTQRIAVFPLNPSWAPPGLGEPAVTQMGPNRRIDYTRGAQTLSAEIGPLEPGWEVEAEREHTATVNGRTATVHTSTTYDGAGPGDRFVGVRWQLPDKRWVQVISLGPPTEADVLRFASGLKNGSVDGTPAGFHLGAYPPQLTLQHQSAETTCLAPEAEAAHERQPTGLCVSLLDDAEPPSDPAGQLSINGNAADYYAGAALLHIHLPSGKVLEITWDPEMIKLGFQDVVHFATGIEVTG
ncbi:hypothetical protein [Paractinoplanes atraurantiacus]|uniref:Uncharacterized protein n=1 Tax=Paractinoplanes atraurantiacus TaxID=1036182 RepID=A0A285KEJ0_9ACTN|nr:hypothetical protein [Actinoplanes atraurantiacus]SNY71032.1 hypothetical protein SAMN05421748_1393 [Actinoplanes atraurantiacus]